MKRRTPGNRRLPDQNGAALTGRRLRLKLGVGELAVLAGVSHSTISNLEHGATTVNAKTWRRIDDALTAAEAARAAGQVAADA